MRFNARELFIAHAEIADVDPPRLRCQLCGHVWAVRVGLGGELLPVGCWFCPECQQDTRQKARRG